MKKLSITLTYGKSLTTYRNDINSKFLAYKTGFTNQIINETTCKGGRIGGSGVGRGVRGSICGGRGGRGGICVRWWFNIVRKYAWFIQCTGETWL